MIVVVVIVVFIISTFIVRDFIYNIYHLFSTAIMIGIQSQKCYQLEMRITNSKARKGIRAKVYLYAASFKGFHKGNKSETAFYEGNDLKVVVLFRNEDHVRDFRNKMSDFRNLYVSQAALEIKISEVDVALTSSQWIDAQDYDTEDFDSPAYTLNEAGLLSNKSGSMSLVTASDPLNEFLMIEDSNNAYLVGLGLYKCHLMSIKNYPDEEHNPNNVLRLSWPVHQRFDGLKTNGVHGVPQIAIKFLGTGGKHKVDVSFGYSEYREEAIIGVEIPNRDLFHALKSTFKVGTTEFTDGDVTLLRTQVYVYSAEEFKRCLSVKYTETYALWKKFGYEGKDVTVEAYDHVIKEVQEYVRRSARNLDGNTTDQLGMVNLKIVN